jgi:hypothetical protein
MEGRSLWWSLITKNWRKEKIISATAHENNIIEKFGVLLQFSFIISIYYLFIKYDYKFEH